MPGVTTIFGNGLEQLTFFESEPMPSAGLAGFAVLETAEAVALLHVFTAEELRQIADALSVGLHLGPREDGRLATELADLVRQRRLFVARRRATMGAPRAPDVAADLADLAEPLVTESPAPSTFAAFRLIDDAGTPIADHAFKLELPDGRTVDGVTGPDGRFEVDPVDSPGNCVVRFR